MSKELILIRVRDVFDENQRTAVNRYFRKYKLGFSKKESVIKRCDNREISKSCNYVSLKDINVLLEKVEKKYSETKNFSVRESIKILESMKKDIESYLENL